MAPDAAALADLVAFARIEVASGDLEPWAMLLAELRRDGTVDDDGALWLVKAYNAYDALDSAWGLFTRWPGGPYQWALDPDAASAAEFTCTQERRNLRGGRVLRHLDSYVAHLAGDPPMTWIKAGLVTGHPLWDFNALVLHLRRVWGVGRQTGFEWAEFLAKVCDVPVRAGNAFLWESEGPRRSLQRLYGVDSPTAGQLDAWAIDVRQHLIDRGVPLSWEDFETVICDFNVARDGRYYPGRHLAALAAELPADDRVHAAWHRVIPAPWDDIAPGIDKAKLATFRDTGRWIDGP